jgi:hypothetical protein
MKNVIITILVLTTLAGCENFFPPPKGSTQNGQVLLNLSPGGGRSLMPDSGLRFSKYVITFTPDAGDDVVFTLTEENDRAALEGHGKNVEVNAGTYTVSISAYQTFNAPEEVVLEAARGSVSNQIIRTDAANSITLALAPIPYNEAEAPDGVFAWNLNLDGGASVTSLTLDDMDLGTSANGQVTMAPGVYNLEISISKSGGTPFKKIETVYIYSGMRTTAAFNLAGLLEQLANVLIAGTLNVTNGSDVKIGYKLEAFSDVACSTEIESAEITVAYTAADSIDFVIKLPIADYNALSTKDIYLKADSRTAVFPASLQPITAVESLELEGRTGVGVSLTANLDFGAQESYRAMAEISAASDINGNWGFGAASQFINGRTVSLSAYNIGKYEVTYKLWQDVREWALENGYRKGDGIVRESPLSTVWPTWVFGNRKPANMFGLRRNATRFPAANPGPTS